MPRALLIIFVLIAAAPLKGAAIPVWIDTDPSVERGGHEVDDGFALLQAFHSPEIEVRGVSVVFGNAPLESVFPIGQRLIRQFGPTGLSVYRGAAGAAELGTETDATHAIEAALRKEPLTVLLLGPATNLATVLRNRPDLSRKIVKIIAVAGRRPGQHFLTGKATIPFRDFNFESDPEAFATILRSRVPLVLTPWEISSRIWITASDLARIRTSGTARWELTDAAADWLMFWKKSFQVDGFNPFDTLAVGYVTSPHLFNCEALPVEIRDMPDDAGPPGLKPYLLVDKTLRSLTSALYCGEAQPAFKADLMNRLTEAGLVGKTRTWFLGLGQNYGVNPIVFGAIYLGAIPFFGVSLGWLIRNLRNNKSVVVPLLSAGFFFVSAYLYLLVAGKNIPVWVYGFVAAMVIFGIVSTLRKIRKAVSL